MRYWITTDTHLGHDNIAKYCNRPNNYNDLIMEGLQVLGVHDVLIHLGDVAFKDKGWEEKYLELSPCKRWLVRGNHDKSYTWHLSRGWNWVGEQMIIDRFGKRIMFSHRPIPSLNCDVQIHGHFHNNPVKYWEGHLKQVIDRKHLLLILEDIGYRPVELKRLVWEKK